jgi:hypothetical protein
MLVVDLTALNSIANKNSNAAVLDFGIKHNLNGYAVPVIFALRVNPMNFNLNFWVRNSSF